MHNVTKLFIAAAIGFGLMTAYADAAEQNMTLTLGGRFCEFYPNELTASLKGVKGVSDVDLTSMKGHAIVKTDGTVKDADLVAAVRNVKGTKMGIDWYCTAEVTK